MVVVVGEDRANYLDIVAHALGEQGPDGPVDETARQDGSFGRSAFPAEEGAGNAAGGIQPLLKIHPQGEEIQVGTGFPGCGGGDETDGVAVPDENRTSGLPRHPADVHRQGTAGQVYCACVMVQTSASLQDKGRENPAPGQLY